MQASRLQLCVLLVSVAAGVLASLLVLLLACRALLNDRHQLTLHTLRHRCGAPVWRSVEKSGSVKDSVLGWHETA